MSPRLLVGVYDSSGDAEMKEKSAHGNPKKSFGRNEIELVSR